MASTAKYVSLAVVFGVSFVCGFIVPYCVHNGINKSLRLSLKRIQRVLSLLNCFSGGVFLATALLALLPEAEEKMSEALEMQELHTDFPFTYLILGGGFLMILMIESCAYSCYDWQARGNRRRAVDSKDVAVNNSLNVPAAGEVKNSTKPDSDREDATSQSVKNGDNSVKESQHTLGSNSNNDVAVVVTNEEHTESNTPQSHDSGNGVSDNPLDMSNIRSIVLIIALSIHMLFDGLELGLLEEESDVWTLLGALSIHKILIFFSMGMTIGESLTVIKFVCSVLFLSLVSPAGIGLGIWVSSRGENVALAMTSAALQALAVGTFLYVAIFEILTKEFHDVVSTGRIKKTVATVFGFAVFAVIKYAMPEYQAGQVIGSRISHVPKTCNRLTMVWVAKLASLGILFVMGTFSGLFLPYIVIRVLVRSYEASHHNSVFRNILAMLNCFSGGVFLATSLIGLLPEAQDKMEEALKNEKYPLSELIVGAGFLLILLIESVAVTLHDRRHSRIQDSSSKTPKVVGEMQNIVPDDIGSHRKYVLKEDIELQNREGGKDGEKTGAENDEIKDDDETMDIPEAKMTNLHSIVLLVALSIHMVFDGLELGLLESDADVWSLLSALTIHKILIFFSMGLTLYESTTNRKFICAMVYMSTVSPVGVGIGMLVSSSNGDEFVMAIVSAFLQGIAVGTFLYVAMFEILMKEFQANSVGHRILKALSVIFGYALFGGIKRAMME
ncbi:uncharacterized protein LOC128214033 [Mya arenaria]|uniref:uncharacterized protein LOC128214033 n=1 Tax=Mya arenaria TaxID=6604 RepID=UPI0022E56B0D|nr:uncharacterized protein LOC128214033 [Mya arenaria]